MRSSLCYCSAQVHSCSFSHRFKYRSGGLLEANGIKPGAFMSLEQLAASCQCLTNIPSTSRTEPPFCFERYGTRGWDFEREEEDPQCIALSG